MHVAFPNPCGLGWNPRTMRPGDQRKRQNWLSCFGLWCVDLLDLACLCGVLQHLKFMLGTVCLVARARLAVAHIASRLSRQSTVLSMGQVHTAYILMISAHMYCLCLFFKACWRTHLGLLFTLLGAGLRICLSLLGTLCIWGLIRTCVFKLGSIRRTLWLCAWLPQLVLQA